MRQNLCDKKNDNFFEYISSTSPLQIFHKKLIIREGLEKQGGRKNNWSFFLCKNRGENNKFMIHNNQSEAYYLNYEKFCIHKIGTLYKNLSLKKIKIFSIF